MEEPIDILLGFEQRITAYRHSLRDLETKRRQTLLRDEADNPHSMISHQAFQNKNNLRPLPADVTASALEDMLVHAV